MASLELKNNIRTGLIEHRSVFFRSNEKHTFGRKAFNS